VRASVVSELRRRASPPPSEAALRPSAFPTSPLSAPPPPGGGRVWDGGGRGRGVPTNHPSLDQRPTGDLRTRLPPPRALRRLRPRADGDDARVPPWRLGIENAPPVPPGPEPKPRNLDPSAARRPRPGRPPCASGYSTLHPPAEGGGGNNVSTTRTGPPGLERWGAPGGSVIPLKISVSDLWPNPNTKCDNS
jgi:hypothetical protein